MKDIIKKTREIYEILGDDLSKEIFINRVCYSITNDKKYIRNIIYLNDDMYSCIKQMEGEEIAVFGAGIRGRAFVQTFDNLKIRGFIDNNKAGQNIYGYEVYSLEEFKKKFKEVKIIILTEFFYEEIYNQLIGVGIKQEKVLNIALIWNRIMNSQYFDLPIFQNKNLGKGVFIDGGAYNGETSIAFINKFSEKNKIILWEADEKNMLQCEKLLNEKKVNYRIINKALWDKKEVLYFNQRGKESCVSENGEIKVNAASIDSEIEEKVTFIKMDIEGAEYKALIGSKNIIKRDNPILAICVYHKPEDIWEIPCLINELNNKYVFYLRHYAFTTGETVLYAVPNGYLENK